MRKQRDKWVVRVDGIDPATGAALADAVDEGLISRSPAARVGLPRTVAKPAKVKEVEAWDTAEVTRFLDATRDHRWAIAFRLGSSTASAVEEVLAIRWDDVGTDAKTLLVDQSLVAVSKGAAWSDARNERSRRRIPLDDETVRALGRRRADQATERLLAGSAWANTDLIIATRQGQLVLPRSYDHALPCSSRRPNCPPHVTWPPPYRGHPDGRRCHRHRPVAGDRRHPWPQP